LIEYFFFIILSWLCQANRLDSKPPVSHTVPPGVVLTNLIYSAILLICSLLISCSFNAIF